jgi:hypothetical protein
MKRITEHFSPKTGYNPIRNRPAEAKISFIIGCDGGQAGDKLIKALGAW